MRVFTALILVLFGVILLAGGIYLAVLGGSWYYIIAGLMLLVSGVLLFRRSIASLLVYAVLMLGTIIWAVWEVGTDFWALAPRLDVLGVLGLWMLIPAVTRDITQPKQPSKWVLAGTLAVAVVLMVVAIFNDPQRIQGAFSTAQPASAQAVDGVADADWPAYGRTQAGQRYSPLTQINDQNVKDLEVAWTYRTGDFKTENDSAETTNQVTPIKIGDNMYMCTTHQWLIALDPATGQQKWKFDPKLVSDDSFQHLTCRGVMYYDAANTVEFAKSLESQKSTSTECQW